MQEPDRSCSEPDYRTGLIITEADTNPASIKLGDRAQDNSGVVEEDTKVEHTSSATEQTNEHHDSDADMPSVSPRFLPISDGFGSSNPEPAVEQKEDLVASFNGDEGVNLSPSSGDSEYVSSETGVISAGEVTPVTSRDLKNDGLLNADSVEFAERLKGQLYIDNFEKELVHLQLSEQRDVQKEFDHRYLQWVNEKAAFSASLSEVEGKDKILSEELTQCRSELDRVTYERDRFSARVEELQIELERSEHQLSNVSSELSDLRVENENLNVRVASLNEEKNELEKEKGDGVFDNEKLAKELMECKSLLETLKLENVNTKGSFNLAMEEKTKLEEEKQNYVRENDSLLTELAEWKRSVEELRVENAKLDDTNEQFVQENKKLSTELLESQLLVESLRSEIAVLNGNLDLITNERSRLREEMDHLSFEKEECLTELASCQILIKRLEGDYQKSMNDLNGSALRIEQFTEENIALMSTLEVYKAKITEFDEWKTKFEQGERVISPSTSKDDNLERVFFEDSSGFGALKQRLSEVDKVIQELEKAIEAMHSYSSFPSAPGVLKLVQNFESKCRTDESEEIPPGEDSGRYMTAKEKMGNLKDLLKDLVLHAENARDVVVRFDVLQEQSNNLEETFVEHVVLDEFLKQYAFAVEAEKRELVGLFEDLWQEETVTKAMNTELTEKLCNSESRIRELQMQVAELHQQSDRMASLNGQLETLQRKLDESIGTISTTYPSETGVDQNIGASVDAAIAVIQDLQGKLEDAHRNHNLLLDSYKDMTEKTKDLEEKSELAAELLHKVYDNLHKLVNVSEPSTEETQTDIRTDKLLDPLEISNYDILIERLIAIIDERGRLESREKFELLERIKGMEELNENTEEQAGLLGEKLKSKETKLIGLQNQIDQSSLLIISYENESHVLKESLKSAMEQLVIVQSEIRLKETELQQCEQRVSALREKLHIAVTKGKGLISQRDSLKQSLTATASELEKCLHELQLKDAALQETETKLKTYSEAGERMEALESELSYIRNSATALRESFLLKDSVLQRIEEILEDLELPEHFHAGDIIEKIDWLARSVSQNSFPDSNWNQRSLMEAGSYTDSGAMDGLREDLEPASVPGDELRRNFEELESKFYGLAEQNEMLERSLMERNNLVQRWEEVLNKISLPPQIRSLEPEDRIEWLRGALSEANGRCEILQQDIYNLENARESLTSDLEDSQRRLVDFEAALQAITNEREQLSASLEARNHDYDRVFEKVALYEIENEKLQNEIDGLRLKLDEKGVDEEHIRHVHGEIRRLQDLVKGVLQVPETEDLDSSTSDIQCLEELLRKLADKYIAGMSGSNHEERRIEQSGIHEEPDLLVLERKLEEIQDDLTRVKEERDEHMEKNRSLVHEVETLEGKNQELQKVLNQEEQKAASVREKLNVAVRKGKSLVQQRDGMKQSINELTSEVERLNSDIKVRENTILEYEQKVKELITLQERMEDKDSEIRFLKNQTNTLSMILGALAKIDLGVEFRTNDPVEKLEQIEKVFHDLRDATSSSEQESRKSKRAAELLLAELNEVQERNEDLLDEISKATMEISELLKERDSSEAAKRESLARLERLSAVLSEERSSQFSELMVLKSGLDQIRPGFIEIYDLLNDVLPKDLDGLYNLEAGIKSLLESSDAYNVGGQMLKGSRGGISSRSETKVSILRSGSFLDGKTEEQFNENDIIDLWRFVGSHIQDLATNIGALEEKLQSHSKCLHEEVILLSETVSTLHREITSHKSSLESAREEIARLESIGQQNESENSVLNRYVSILYESCKNLVLEIEKSRSQLIANDSNEGGYTFSGQSLSTSEEHITSMVNRLSTLVKDIHGIQAETVEGNQKELKATISSLQKELNEKDIQKDKISMELVSQIKQAEAAAVSHLQELEPAKAQIRDLKEQLEAVNLELEQRVKELEGQESILVDFREKVKSLTDALTAKEQEAEALLQALDEEEAQMEDLTNKVTDLERLVQQKDLDLESAEASRGKALKKLSVTVSKFDELHHLSETLLSEVDKLQSQLQERDSEISFLRDEITRCTSDSLLALSSDKKGFVEFQEILTWLDSMISGVQSEDVHLDENKTDQVQDYKDVLQKKITSIISELEDLRQVGRIKDDQLQIERRRVEDLMRKRELLENSLRENESRLSMHQNAGDPAHATSMTSEIVEVEPMVNKWSVQGTSVAPQVRSMRKVNNEQLAISIDDVDSDNRDKLEDEDDDKAHGFKSLTTSKLIPRFTRPVTNLVDGLWVSCDRALMRQPLLRLSLIIYWAVMHALLATFVV